ncbi:MAG: transposase [Lachnospiraceae bacterium]|nr:transposase [Lachnospiraceae bacterium]
MTNNLVSNSIFSVPPGVIIQSAEECPEENRIILDIEFEPTEQVCPECASRHCRPDGFCKVRTLRHLPVAGNSVFLRYTPRHFVCDDCGAVFRESVSWIHSRLQMTEALFIEIYLSLTENVSIRSIAEKECVSECVVQHVLKLSAAERPAELPEVLCLFDFKANVGTWNPDTHSWDMYTSLCGIADGSTGELLDILPDTRVAGLSGYFGSYAFNQLRQIRYVVCDMGNSALSAAVTGRFFPSAMVGIESSHVTRRLNAAMNRIRMRILRSSEQQEPALSEEDRMLLKNNARLLIMRPVPGNPSASPEADNGSPIFVGHFAVFVGVSPTYP